MLEAEARRRLGQVFALNLPKSWDELDLERFPVANYIVFRDDLGSSFEVARNRIQEARSFLHSHGIEALFMADEEGGRVTQISDFFLSAPSPRAIARTLKPEEAGTLYAQVSAYIAGLGIDVNLFPCVDVNTEALNPVIGTRSYGGFPGQVSSYSKAALDSSRTQTACVAKHFPGHGMTEVDPHRELPIVDDPREKLECVHIRPFKQAIRCGVDGIMVSHCLYTSLQTDDLPASLSKQIVGNLLRGRLGFEGLVLTDSLDMGSVTQNVDARRAALLALEAGCDILLYTEHSERFENSFEALLETVLMDRLNGQFLIASNRRRSKLVQRLGWLRQSPATFREQTYIELVNKVRSRSIQIQDPGGVLPLSCNRAVLVSTSVGITERLKSHIPSVEEVSEASDLAGNTLILWIMEPLTLGQSFEEMRSQIEAAQTAVLITTYEALLEMLPDCDVTIVSHDSSPHAEEVIITRLFEA